MRALNTILMYYTTTNQKGSQYNDRRRTVYGVCHSTGKESTA